MDPNKPSSPPDSTPVTPEEPSQPSVVAPTAIPGPVPSELPTPAATAPISPTDQTDPLTEDVEKDLVQHILDNIGEDKLSLEDAQKLAQEFLTLIPFKDKKDLVDKLNLLGQQHDEVKPIYLKYAAPMAEEERLRKIEEMSAHIKAGNIEHAITVAKGGTVTNGGQ